MDLEDEAQLVKVLYSATRGWFRFLYNAKLSDFFPLINMKRENWKTHHASHLTDNHHKKWFGKTIVTN